MINTSSRPAALFYRLSLVFLLFAIGLGGCTEGISIIRATATNAPPAPRESPTTSPRPSETATALHVTPTFTLRPSNTPPPAETNTPAPSPTATPLTCWSDGGHFEFGSLPTEQLRLPMDYRVYLPPCYDDEPERRYPVLYLIHGQSYTDDQWDRLGADESADRLIGSGELAPFIIVMPRDRFGGQPSENNFAQVVVEEIIPMIDASYRTLPDRKNRAVGGLSRGGGWAVHLAMTQWEMFGAMGAHSPAIFYDDAQFMRVYLDAIPEAAYPRIYIDIGDKDRPGLMSAAVWFEDLLNQWGVPHEWYLYSGYHAEEYWSAHIDTYLLWYAREW